MKNPPGGLLGDHGFGALLTTLMRGPAGASASGVQSIGTRILAALSCDA
jgi:hypothetical protein